MCVMSMVMDNQWDKWKKLQEERQPQVWPYIYPTPIITKPLVTEEEIEEFKKTVENARKYDVEHNEPNCELSEKKERLRRLAEQLGVKIDFLDEKPYETNNKSTRSKDQY